MQFHCLNVIPVRGRIEFREVKQEETIPLQCGIRNQLDVTQYYIYFFLFLLISCSTCFGPPCAHLQELTTQCYFSTCVVVPWLCRQIDPVSCLCVHWNVRSTTYNEKQKEINIILCDIQLVSYSTLNYDARSTTHQIPRSFFASNVAKTGPTIGLL